MQPIPKPLQRRREIGVELPESQPFIPEEETFTFGDTYKQKKTTKAMKWMPLLISSLLMISCTSQREISAPEPQKGPSRADFCDQVEWDVQQAVYYEFGQAKTDQDRIEARNNQRTYADMMISNGCDTSKVDWPKISIPQGHITIIPIR